MQQGSITIRGQEARIYWNYLLVGTVGAWTVTRHSPADPGTITAVIGSIDSFRASQHPLEFRVTHQHGVWRWPLQSLRIEGNALTAALAPQETT